MKIAVRNIPQVGLDIDKVIAVEEIGLSRADLDIQSPIAVKAHVERVDDFIIATTDVTAKYGYTCARCLESFEDEQTRHFNFDYELQKTTEFIDLGDDIRQEMIL